MFKTTLTAAVIASFAMTANASSTSEYTHLPAAHDASFIMADTRTKDNRDDRQDDRQDCRQEEGAGKDKRDCKQESKG